MREKLTAVLLEHTPPIFGPPPLSSPSPLARALQSSSAPSLFCSPSATMAELHSYSLPMLVTGASLVRSPPTLGSPWSLSQAAGLDFMSDWFNPTREPQVGGFTSESEWN